MLNAKTINPVRNSFIAIICSFVIRLVPASFSAAEVVKTRRGG